jgi:hypothetical protein
VAALADARLVVVPRATHNVHSDNPAGFAAALDAFLTDVLAGDQASSGEGNTVVKDGPRG